MALLNASVGGLGDWVEFEAGTVSMSSDDLEASVVDAEVLPNVEGEDSGVVPGEEVLAFRSKFPVLNFLQFLVALALQFGLAPLNSVVR